jgi:hypothetical protein
VLVAAVAGIGRVAVWMTGRACSASTAMVHRKAMRAVVRRRTPSPRRVA